MLRRGYGNVTRNIVGSYGSFFPIVHLCNCGRMGGGGFVIGEVLDVCW